MELKPDKPSPQIDVARVARFDRYYATLPEDEQKALDQSIEGLCNKFRERGVMFGPKMAKELIVALIDFKSTYGRPRRRIH